jgi:hypothetical protein
MACQLGILDIRAQGSSCQGFDCKSCVLQPRAQLMHSHHLVPSPKLGHHYRQYRSGCRRTMIQVYYFSFSISNQSHYRLQRVRVKYRPSSNSISCCTTPESSSEWVSQCLRKAKRSVDHAQDVTRSPLIYYEIGHSKGRSSRKRTLRHLRPDPSCRQSVKDDLHSCCQTVTTGTRA